MNKDLDEVKSDRAKVKKQMRDTQDEIGILKSKIKTARNELQEYKVKFWNFFWNLSGKKEKTRRLERNADRDRQEREKLQAERKRVEEDRRKYEEERYDVIILKND